MIHNDFAIQTALGENHIRHKQQNKQSYSSHKDDSLHIQHLAKIF